MSERINQTITRVLKCNKGVKITKLIHKVNFVLQNSPHSVLRASPFEVCHRYSKFDTEKRVLPDVIPMLKQLNDYANEKNNKRINKDRKPYNFTVGESVYLLNKQKSKLDATWIGPYTIRKKNKFI